MPNWVGDACMATPALRSIRRAFPEAHICGVTRPVIGQLIWGAWGDDAPWFDDLVYVGKPRWSRLKLVPKLRAQRLDAMLLLTNSFWSAAVVRLSLISNVVGYDRDMRGWLLSHRVPVPSLGRRYRPVSAIDYYLQLAESIGCETRDRRMQLRVTRSEQQAAARLWEAIGFSDVIPTVVVNSNAARSAPRVWQREKVLQLCLKLAEESGYQVLLHCGPSEREAANDIAVAAGHPLVASMGAVDELPIGLSKAVLSQAAVVVSTDSGPRHVAAALNRPVVSLFGPTDVAWTTTYNVPEQIIEVPASQLNCRPCYQNKCPLKHHRCMRDISVERVLQAVRRQLTGRVAA